ncbi:DMT family transporter [Geitlerinema sp. PCC 9228]|jgi:drug/metabolite transporter (DMT)-like permease|uniref:DMT family transporter n=1 Tax=Geitlerinema sp. PCC 9228 TaxID=111611 RepID=UPI0008F9D94A|nr:DMT family transporter [Geitlerinema sp. PCC 9228]
MVWFLLANCTAFSESLKDVFSKRNLRIFDGYFISWMFAALTFFFLLPLLLVVPIPPLGDRFGLALLASGSLNVLATLLYLHALQRSDMSLSLPMITLTPLFLLVTSPLIVGESPQVFDLVGVVFLVVGTYTLNFQVRKEGWLVPFQALLREAGPRFMLGVALLWSLTANFDKMGVQNSSPLFWAIASYGYIALVLSPIVWFKSKISWQQIWPQRFFLVAVGMFNALTVTCQMSAINLTTVVNVISIKRTSVLWGVLWGHLFFAEPGFKTRMSAALLMVTGVFFISIS